MHKLFLVLGIVFIAIGLFFKFIYKPDNMKNINGKDIMVVSSTRYQIDQYGNEVSSYWDINSFNQLKKEAEGGNINAQITLAELYFNGIFVSENIDKAEYWLLKAVKSGNALAQADLAYLYLEQYKDKEAKIWLEKSAKQGNIDATYNLALLLYEEEKENKDFAQIINLLERVANNKETVYVGEVEYLLAWILLTEKEALNVSLGKVYLESAVAKGNAPAEYLMGELYEEGEIYPKNMEKAKELYVKAASKQLPEAIDKIRELGINN